MKAIWLSTLLPACATASWQPAPVATPESASDIPGALSAWSAQIQLSLDTWQSTLPPGCAVPTVLGDRGMPVVLLSAQEWSSLGIDPATAGHFYRDEERIVVRGDVEHDLVGLVAHELGHSMGWFAHSADRASLMYASGDGSRRPTNNDGAILARVLGCEP